MNFVSKKLLKVSASVDGHRAIRVATMHFLLLTIVRRCIHRFSPDGGVSSITGVDDSIVGGEAPLDISKNLIQVG